MLQPASYCALILGLQGHDTAGCCRDAENLVALEAIKAMFGTLPSEAGPLGGAAPPEDFARAARTRQRAWAFVSSQARAFAWLGYVCQLVWGQVVLSLAGKLHCTVAEAVPPGQHICSSLKV